MKIHLGCGNRKPEGYVNVDVNPNVSPDIVHDLTVYPWPFANDCADEIAAMHVIEHLISQGDMKSFNNFFRECWRLLKPGGLLKVVVPDANGGRAFSDPSHKSFYNRDAFAFISKNAIKLNRESNSCMSSVEIDYDFDLASLNTINDEIHLNGVAVK